MSDLADPSAPTHSWMNRRVFVGLSAGAAAVATSPASALAADSDDYGKPHPPIVAPDDPALVIQTVHLSRPDIKLDAYAAWPVGLTPTTPSIVMVQHIWGVDATIRDDVRRYAKAGYLCVAPLLYERSHAPSGDGTSDIELFRPAAAALDDPTVHGDLLAARNWALSMAPQTKVGITGFCMGGGIALKQLIGSSDYAAASIFYGDVRPGTGRKESTDSATFDYAAQITTPIRGNYGARDTSIAAADVRSLFTKLTVAHELDIYAAAGHAFFDDTRESYVAPAATDAWTKTLSWFHTYLS